MACTAAIPSKSNTINKLHIQSDLHYDYKQNFYHDFKKEMDGIFDEYHLPLLKNIDHPAFIQELKQYLDAAAYEIKSNQEIKIPTKKK